MLNFRREELSRVLVVLTFLGIGWLSYPFIAAFGPAQDSIQKWQTHINLEEIEPGEIREYLVTGETIWIYRRTQEEIDWLQSREAYAAGDYRFSDAESVEYHEKYRSLTPNYFVFSARKYDDLVHLKYETHWWRCGSIGYYPGIRELRDSVSLNGVIACTSSTVDVKLENESFVYDIAGVPASKWMAPLKIPYYEISDAGDYLIHGPRP